MVVLCPYGSRKQEEIEVAGSFLGFQVIGATRWVDGDWWSVATDAAVPCAVFHRRDGGLVLEEL